MVQGGGRGQPAPQDEGLAPVMCSSGKIPMAPSHFEKLLEGSKPPVGIRVPRSKRVAPVCVRAGHPLKSSDAPNTSSEQVLLSACLTHLSEALAQF